MFLSYDKYAIAGTACHWRTGTDIHKKCSQVWLARRANLMQALWSGEVTKIHSAMNAGYSQCIFLTLH